MNAISTFKAFLMKEITKLQIHAHRLELNREDTKRHKIIPSKTWKTDYADIVQTDRSKVRSMS